MDDDGFMDRALETASRGQGRTSPNPMVGAVIVKDGRIVGEGCHEAVGQAHAEVNALNAAGEVAAGPGASRKEGRRVRHLHFRRRGCVHQP